MHQSLLGFLIVSLVILTTLVHSKTDSEDGMHTPFTHALQILIDFALHFVLIPMEIVEWRNGV